MILHLLLKESILSFDDTIINTLKTDRYFQLHYFTYLFAEIGQFLDHETYDQILMQFLPIKDQYNPEDIEKMKQIGENESRLCQLIRKDSIDEFIEYVNQEKVSLSANIDQSIFETNPFLIKRNPTIIEYSVFFGSIKILNYLFLNGIKSTSSLWIYAIHSRNTEILKFLKEKKVDLDIKKCLKESLKCHHFEITDYILNNLMKNLEKGDNEVFSISIKYMNFVYFPNDLSYPVAFYYLCKFDFIKIVNIILKNSNDSITNQINNEIPKSNF